jgi:hypothetical protein
MAHQIQPIAIQCQFGQAANKILCMNAGRHQMQIRHTANENVTFHIQHCQNATASAPNWSASIHLQRPISTLSNGANLSKLGIY